MNKELINRIELALRLSDSEIVSDVLDECRAALTKKYVPMTDKELYKIWIRADGGVDGALLAIQSKIIRRAGLEVQE